MSEELLAEVYGVLREHAKRKGQRDHDNLARLIGKLLKRKPHSRSADILIAVGAQRVHVVKEQWPMERVLRFEGNSELRDGDDTIPLVVFRIDGRDELIDGGKRVTRWRRRGDTHSPWVLVVSLAPRSAHAFNPSAAVTTARAIAARNRSQAK